MDDDEYMNFDDSMELDIAALSKATNTEGPRVDPVADTDEIMVDAPPLLPPLQPLPPAPAVAVMPQPPPIVRVSDLKKHIEQAPFLNFFYLLSCHGLLTETQSGIDTFLSEKKNGNLLLGLSPKEALDPLINSIFNEKPDSQPDDPEWTLWEKAAESVLIKKWRTKHMYRIWSMTKNVSTSKIKGVTVDWNPGPWRWMSAFHYFRLVHVQCRLGLYNLERIPGRLFGRQRDWKAAEWTEWQELVVVYGSSKGVIEFQANEVEDVRAKINNPGLLLIEQIWLSLPERIRMYWESVALELDGQAKEDPVAWWAVTPKPRSIHEGLFWAPFAEMLEKFKSILNERFGPSATSILPSTLGAQVAKANPRLSRVVLHMKRGLMVAAYYAKLGKLKAALEDVSICARQAGAGTTLVDKLKSLGVDNVRGGDLERALAVLDVGLGGTADVHKHQNNEAHKVTFGGKKWNVAALALAQVAITATLNPGSGIPLPRLDESVASLNKRARTGDDDNEDAAEVDDDVEERPSKRHKMEAHLFQTLAQWARFNRTSRTTF